MASLTRAEIKSVLGPVDEVVVTEIMKSGASLAELAQAHAWLVNEEALINEGRRLPTGRIGELIELLSSYEVEEDPEGPPSAPA
jgi:hypothetical protein